MPKAIHQELVIAGAGGQGILLIGWLVALAATNSDKHTTWFPTYGPTMRGGNAACAVVVSSKEIGSPTLERYDSLIVMNPLALARADKVKPKGLIILNKSSVAWDNRRKDIEVLEINAGDIAKELGSPQLTNIVLLGAYIKKKWPAGFSDVSAALREYFTQEGKSGLIDISIKALLRGWQEAGPTL